MNVSNYKCIILYGQIEVVIYVSDMYSAIKKYLFTKAYYLFKSEIHSVLTGTITQ